MPDFDPIHEMEETDVGEVSSVDLPATARRWTLFKSLRRKAEHAFPGLGSGETGTPTSGPTAPGLPNLEQLLAENPDMDPAVAEAIDAGGGLADVLASDMPNGDEGTVSDPPTAGDFASAKRVLARLAKYGIKGPEVDACVQSALANPEFGPGDFPDRESRAFAICQEQFATEDGMPKPVKQEEEIVPVEPMAEPAPAAAIEIETSPVQWPFATCVADAQELGMGTEDAAVTCMLIRDVYGDPDDEEMILVPDELTPEGLLTSAAIQAGIATVAGAEGGGGEGEGEAAPEEDQLRLEPIENPIKFDGKNRWKRSWRDRLGLNRRRTLSMPERALRRLGKEVAELKDDQIKSRADLQTALDRQTLVSMALMRALGVDTSDLISEIHNQGAPKPAAEPSPASLATEGAAPEKSGKDDTPPAAAPTAPVTPAAVAAATPAIATPPEGLEGEALMAWYRDNYNRISAIVAAAPMSGNEAPAVEAAEPEPDPIEVALAAAAGTAEGVDLGPGEEEEEPELVVTAAAAAPITGATVELVPGKGIRRRKSAGPTGAGHKRVKMVKSTLLGGALIPEEDRKKCGW